MRSTVLCAAVWGFALAASGPAQGLPAPAAAAAQEPRRVVILNEADPTLPAFVLVDRGIRAVLADPNRPRVDIFYEVLDMLRFPEAMYENELVALMAKKYAALRVDAVIVVGPISLAFAGRHRDRLWPGAFIVFQGVPTELLRRNPLPPRTTGTAVQQDFAGIAALALRLRPSTRRLIVVSGTGDLERMLVGVVRAQLAAASLKLPVEYWEDLRIDDLMRRAAALDRDDALLYLAMGRDADGGVFVPREVLRRLADSTPAPVYGAYETYAGHGMLAGLVYVFEARGRHTGELVQRILASGSSDAPPGIEIEPSTCVADARRMERQRMALGLLPPDCDVRFLSPSIWNEYRAYVLAAVAVMLAQFALITVLVLERRGRMKAEREVRHRRTELAQASRLALAGELTASIAHEINQPLGAILANAGAAEALLKRGPGGDDEVRAILGDIQRADIRASEIIQRVKALVSSRETERVPLAVNALVADALSFLEGDARRRGVTVEAALTGGLPPILADRVQLQQAIVNLCVNAMEAMSGCAPGTKKLDVQTRLGADGGVDIVVTDSGPGIPGEHLPQLFDAFFTTKAQGTGLGLSITRSIVEAHHGTITAENRGEGGALFRITFPARTRVTG